MSTFHTNYKFVVCQNRIARSSYDATPRFDVSCADFDHKPNPVGDSTVCFSVCHWKRSYWIARVWRPSFGNHGLRLFALSGNRSPFLAHLSVELGERGVPALAASAGRQRALGRGRYGVALGAVAPARELPTQGTAVLRGRAWGGPRDRGGRERAREEKERLRRSN